MDIADLLSDESFINYCKKTSPEDMARWERYINENPDSLAQIQQAKEHYFNLFNALAMADRDEQELKLRDKLNNIDTAGPVEFDRGEKNPNNVFSLLVKMASAAAILVFAVFVTVKLNHSAKKETFKSFVANYAEKKNFQLPDGSIVTLNAGSKINIKENYGMYSRDVYLEGEAFFDVKHNAELPFIVHTPAMDVKALGTAFNVRAYPGEKLTETALVRGLIEVTLNEEKVRKVILHPNQKVVSRIAGSTMDTGKPANVTINNQVIVNDDQVQNIVKNNQGDIVETAWIENKLIFEDEPFADIANSLERWYGVKIVFADDNIRQYRFTGIFEKEKLETVFSVLKESKNFNYKMISGDTLTINISK